MKKKLFILVFTILNFNSYSQTQFEKGYFINNSNQIIDCYIKNIDWKNNPTQFEYKLSENIKSQKSTIKLVKEFSIYNKSKYIRKTINIDRSSNNINKLSKDRNPIFKEEELFLKVLVEGKSNLYQYVDDNLIRYFYSKENSNIEQLIFKHYITKENYEGSNNRFRQQLWADLKCPNHKMSKIESVDYNKKELINYFTEYSKCHNNELVYLEKKEKKGEFNFSLRPRLNNSTLTIKNPERDYKNSYFENKTGFGLGLEVEFIFPSKKNKWSLLIEPTYQYYNSKTSREAEHISGGTLISKIDFSSIEVPIGVRHYFSINKSSKFFVNAAVMFDIILTDEIKFTRIDGSISDTEKIDTTFTPVLGFGYKFNDKFCFEIRRQFHKKILARYPFWESDFNPTSIVFGYSFL